MKFVSNYMNTFCFTVSYDSYFIVKQNETHFFVRVLLFDFLNLRLNSTKDALFPGDESFIFIMGSW